MSFYFEKEEDISRIPKPSYSTHWRCKNGQWEMSAPDMSTSFSALAKATEVGKSIWTKLKMTVTDKQACSSFVKQIDCIIMVNNGHTE